MTLIATPHAKDSDDEEEKKGEEDAGFGTTAADGGESKLVKDIMNEAKVRDCG